MPNNEINEVGIYPAAGTVPCDEVFDRLQWEVLPPERIAEKLIGFTVIGAEPPVGPEGVLVLYGHYRGSDQLVALSIVTANVDMGDEFDGLMCYLAPLPPTA